MNSAHFLWGASKNSVFLHDTPKPQLPQSLVAQNRLAGVTQVLVFGSMYHGAICVHVIEPQPNGAVCFLFVCSLFVPQPSVEPFSARIESNRSVRFGRATGAGF